ncbi:MAG: regulatory protein RecX [Nocardioidaceae bacterium]|nr:regulatory protein RecX [Nocardioidaceae bacterium]
MAGRPARRRRRAGPAEPAGTQQDLGPPADPESVARTILLTKLTAQARSRQELADALAAKAVPDDVAERVLDRFEQVGLVDDAAFADRWVRSRQSSRGLSRRALAHELRAKGIDNGLISTSLEQVQPADEHETAHRLVQRKLRSTRGLDRLVRTRRLAGMLARKGYPPGVAMQVVRDALAAEESDETADSWSS